MQYTPENILVKPNGGGQDGLVTEVTPALAGWEFINFQVRQLASGAEWRFNTGGHELAIVMLRGTVDVDANTGSWKNLGGRANVFEGAADSLYLSINTTFTVTAQSDAEFAVTWVKAEQEFPPQRISPANVNVEIRGGDNVTRQINDILRV